MSAATPLLTLVPVELLDQARALFENSTHPDAMPEAVGPWLEAWLQTPQPALGGQTAAVLSKAGLTSERHGCSTCASAIVPEESVVLINPRHPEARVLKARALRRVEFQRSLRSGP